MSQLLMEAPGQDNPGDIIISSDFYKAPYEPQKTLHNVSLRLSSNLQEE